MWIIHTQKFKLESCFKSIIFDIVDMKRYLFIDWLSIVEPIDNQSNWK